MNNQKHNVDSDDEFKILIFPLLLGLFFLVAWFGFHKYISAFYIYIRYLQLSVPAFLGGFIDIPPFSSAREWVIKYCNPQGVDVFGICAANFETVKISTIINSTIILNLITLLPVLYIGIKSYKKVGGFHPFLIFKKTPSIKSFMQEKQAEYPHLKMFVNLDLVKKDLSDPVFGMPLSAREFVREHQLISGWQEVSDGRTFIPTLDIEKTKRVLISQLGTLWTGNNFMELSSSEILMMAIAVPLVAATDTKLSDDEFYEIKKTSQKMIKFCWDQFQPPEQPKKKSKKHKMTDNNENAESDYAWLKPDINLTEARQIIVRFYKESEYVRKIFKKHAYVSTIIYGLFLEARRLGVLPAAEVRWLRFYDKRMYIIISNIGRPSAHPEGCAIHAHYLYEAAGNVGYAEPMVNKAINALLHQIQSFKYESEHVAMYKISTDKS